MKYSYERLVYLSDTDAAGVVFFSNILNICHEAYEMSLFKFGIKLNCFVDKSPIFMPIVHSSIDFFHPIFCSDLLIIQLTTKIVEDTEFEVNYEIYSAHQDQQKSSKILAEAKTRHVCIDAATRTRTQFSAEIWQWLQ
jgi:1,4-dihydroxy-2-naphthoyl-CoA hydrolase